MGHLDMSATAVWGMSGQEIFVNFTDPASGPLGLNEGVRLVTGVSRDQYGDVEELRAVAVKLESAWQGAAADAANRGLTPFAIEQQSSADALGQASSLMSDQSGAFTSARSRVVPVPPVPDRPPVLAILANPSATTSYLQQATATDAASKHNIAVMQGYEAAAEHNTRNMPAAYGDLVPDKVAVVGEPPATTGPQAPGRQVRVRPGSRPVPKPRSAKPPATARPRVPEPVVPPAVGSGATPGTPGETSPAASPLRREPGSTNPESLAEVGDPVDRRFVGAGAPAPAGGAKPVAAPEEPVTGRPGTATHARPGFRSTTSEGVAARTGTRGAGIGAAPIAAGAGRGRSEDEQREQPAFLLEPEPEDLFGTDEVTAPSVIE